MVFSIIGLILNLIPAVINLLNLFLGGGWSWFIPFNIAGVVLFSFIIRRKLIEKVEERRNELLK